MQQNHKVKKIFYAHLRLRIESKSSYSTTKSKKLKIVQPIDSSFGNLATFRNLLRHRIFVRIPSEKAHSDFDTNFLYLLGKFNFRGFDQMVGLKTVIQSDVHSMPSHHISIPYWNPSIHFNIDLFSSLSQVSSSSCSLHSGNNFLLPDSFYFYDIRFPSLHMCLLQIAVFPQQGHYFFCLFKRPLDFSSW